MPVVHKVIFFLMYKTTFFVVRIELTKTFISLRLNIKPTRPTTSILRAHQIYMVSQD